MCGLVAAAAQRTSSALERQQLSKLAKRYATSAMSRKVAAAVGVPYAALACLRGDRAQAIRALQARLAENPPPLHTQLARRRLGELLGGLEGAQLIDEADQFLREGGVVDPQRFTAAVMPGLEIA